MSQDRIQKILARGGIASRRAAEQLITAGRVRVNGKVVTELGAKADPYNDKVEVDGRKVVAENLVYVVLHKPRGVVATLSDPEGRPTVKELFEKVGTRIYPVGRLDFSTSGILLATNDGAFADGLLHPKRSVPKTYVLKVKGKMQEADVEKWRKGVVLEDGITLPADAKVIRHEDDKTWLELTIREGRNQQIRRMGEATRFPVMRLARITFADVSSEGLKPGQWRYLTRDELLTLKKQYGVPRSIPAIPAQPDPRKMRPREFGERRPGAGKPARSSDDAPKNDEGFTAKPRAPGRRKAPTAPREKGRGGEGRARAPSANTGGRGRSGARTTGASTGTDSPRYGGGSPGRRNYEVKDDWGGGAGRGRTGSSDASASRDSRDTPPGRGGRSRTTGTGGGIGANSDMPRVKSRRR